MAGLGNAVVKGTGIGGTNGKCANKQGADYAFHSFERLAAKILFFAINKRI
jgi:hypothetical protein